MLRASVVLALLVSAADAQPAIEEFSFEFDGRERF